MKKIFSFLLTCFLLTFLAACGSSNSQTSTVISNITSALSQSSSAPESEENVELSVQEEPESPETNTQSKESEPAEDLNSRARITVQFGEEAVIYELNDSPAAQSLLEQLPLTMEVEDYSTNEKIFYPPQELDTSSTPVAVGGAGTLAYYAPWGDVVMFYGDYNENPSLFELGQIVSGGDLISQMNGVITITVGE